MPNFNPNQTGLKNSQKWEHLPTVAARIPQIFLEDVLEFARVRDRSSSGFEIIINLLQTLTGEELEQLQLAIDSLKPTAKAPAVSSDKYRELSDLEKADYKNRFGFIPSKYQVGIIDWILKGSGNACCNAVAGAGKSSSLFIIAKVLEKQGIRPSEVKVCVFGKENSKDLIKKFGVGWQSSISTLHSAGWSLVKQELGIKDSYSVKVSSKKYRAIASSFNLVPGNGSKQALIIQEKIVTDADTFFKLIDLVRLYNLQATAENLQQLCEHHEIEGLKKPIDAALWIRKCLTVGENQAANKIGFDFTDQLWLPVKWALSQRPWFKPYKFVLVDECQDLNAVQLELICMLAGNSGRILAVGDPRQAIMGFAGADCDSYEAIGKRINAIELPLSICYRCPSSHIKLVKDRFPNIPIEPKPEASSGVIQQINKNEILSHIQNKDMVLSRKTAPLVSLCLKLIANKKNAQIKGRAIGDNLKTEMKTIENYFYFNWNEFNNSLEMYFNEKSATYAGLENEEQLRENFKDKVEAIKAIYQASPGARNMDDLAAEIEKVFSDENAPITLSTCHRAKGLEAERIFIYEPTHMLMEWKNQKPWQYEQEENLLYVALTRSKSELFIVGECEWYTAPETNTTITKTLERLDKEDYFSINANAAAQLNKDLEEVFRDDQKRKSFVKKIVDDPYCLQDMEDCGILVYRSEESKIATRSAVSSFIKEFERAIAVNDREKEEKQKYDDDF